VGGGADIGRHNAATADVLTRDVLRSCCSRMAMSAVHTIIIIIIIIVVVVVKSSINHESYYQEILSLTFTNDMY